MANLQAIGVDGVTAIYLLAEGMGTDQEPFISGFNVNNWPSSYEVTGTFWQATQPVSLDSLPSLPTGDNAIGSITNSSFGISGNLPAFAATPTVNIGTIGTITNNPIAATTSTLTNVASSATSVTLLASNSNRKTVIIVNDSTAILYIKFDSSAASTISYSLVIPPISNSIPSFITFDRSDYSGAVTGIWSSANGNARITEVV